MNGFSVSVETIPTLQSQEKQGPSAVLGCAVSTCPIAHFLPRAAPLLGLLDVDVPEEEVPLLLLLPL